MSGDESRPTDPASGSPLPATTQPGYYPGYSTLSQQDWWDATTRETVLTRVREVPEIHFFSGPEVDLMQAVCDRVLPQDDRDPAFRIPIVNYIDDRLHRNILDGYRYDDMPIDQEAFRLGLRAIDQIASHMYGRSFVDLGPKEQDEALFTLHDARPPAAQDIWKRMNVERFWLLLVQDVVAAYYAHPYAWDEIGFGGPAYPRGYMRLEDGKPEPWEVNEARYEWEPPNGSLSGEYRPLGGAHPHHPPPGQAGTH